MYFFYFYYYDYVDREIYVECVIRTHRYTRPALWLRRRAFIISRVRYFSGLRRGNKL